MDNQTSGDRCRQPVPASFRDPSGFIFRSNGTLYRQVNRQYRADYDKLMGSGLYRELVEKGWLVAHEEVDSIERETQDAYKVLRPELIDFISYPYEWAFTQLQDAALVTLDIQLASLERGLSLKDASAYNVQFRQGRPVFIDTLSFEIYEEGQPWVAYRQFCMHFLAPLALMARRDARLSLLMRTYIDGIPLDLASKLLPIQTWFSFGMLSHIHLHARAERAFSRTEGKRQGERNHAGKVSKLGLQGVLHGLRQLIASLSWRPTGTEWGDYYDATNYSSEAFGEKERLVTDFLHAIAPKRVWDLGANTGVFSRLASSQGIPTVAFDVDVAAVERNHLRLKNEGPAPLLPLVLDLTNPSPGLGWAGTERDSLASRGPVDCVLALALVHHLAISNNVPLGRIADFFALLGKNLIIEFVPKEDSQVQRLLSGRPDIFPDYTQTGFETAFKRAFGIERRERVQGSERVLYWMRCR